MDYRKKKRRDRLCSDIFRTGFSKTITAMILILVCVLSIAVVEANKHISYLHSSSRAGIYEIAEWFWFTHGQVDKLVEGARNRANDNNWK